MARVIWDTVRIYLEPAQHDAVRCELAGVTRKETEKRRKKKNKKKCEEAIKERKGGRRKEDEEA